MKKTLITISILLTFIWVGPKTFAQQNIPDESCLIDFQTFISSHLSFTDFASAWSDILVLYPQNTCYFNDISGIKNQLRNVQKQIRAGFYACNAASTLALQDQYNKLEAELFYLRHFIDVSQSKVTKIPDNKVYEELRQEFVIDKQYYDDAMLKTIFDSFKSKYEARIENTYAKCKDQTLEGLKKKWNSLAENFKKMAESQEKAVTAEWQKAVNNPPKKTQAQLGGVIDTRVNNVQPPRTPDQILTQLTAESPSGFEPTLDVLQLAVYQEIETFNTNYETANIMGEYEALYKKSGDTLGKDFEQKIIELNKIIKETFKPLEELTKCSKKVGEKQCK